MVNGVDHLIDYVIDHLKKKASHPRERRGFNRAAPSGYILALDAPPYNHSPKSPSSHLRCLTTDFGYVPRRAGGQASSRARASSLLTATYLTINLPSDVGIGCQAGILESQIVQLIKHLLGVLLNSAFASPSRSERGPVYGESSRRDCGATWYIYELRGQPRLMRLSRPCPTLRNTHSNIAIFKYPF